MLVIGAGVAGLQAIGTARRLGAVVTGYDVRDAARADVASTGAAFLDLGAAGRPTTAGDADGGYARELTADEKTAQQDALVHAVATFDIVITTAQVPGRRPPVLVSAAAVAAMATGSVIVDLGSGPLGGNVVGSVPDTATVTDNGVTVIGAGALPSTVPARRIDRLRPQHRLTARTPRRRRTYPPRPRGRDHGRDPGHRRRRGRTTRPPTTAQRADRGRSRHGCRGSPR